MSNQCHKELSVAVQVLWLALLVLPNLSAAQSVPPAEQSSVSPKAVFQRVSHSVFVVLSMDANGETIALGSAVAVVPDEVVTNQHVAAQASSFRVVQGDKSWRATKANCSVGHDLCRLKVSGLSAKPILVRASKTLAVGEQVFAVGAPQGLELTFSDGLISALRPESGVYLVQTTAPISHGSSGGGLFDEQGNLVGITTFGFKEGQNLNFALPGEWVVELGVGRQAPFLPSPSPKPGQHVSDHSSLAAILEEQGQLVDAEREYTAAIKARPNDATLKRRLGDLLRKQERWDEAIGYYQAALVVNPTESLAHSGIAKSLAGQGKLDAAIVEFRTAVSASPSSLESRLDLSLALFQHREWDACLSELSETVRKHPTSGEAHALLGRTLLVGKNDPSKALPELQEAIRLGADSDDTKQAFERATALVESMSPVNQARDKTRQAMEEFSKKNLDDAIAGFREAIRLDSTNVEAQLGLARALVSGAHEQPTDVVLDEAASHYETALSLKPTDTLHTELGNLLAFRGNLVGAMREYQTALKINPYNKEAHFTLANALAQAGDLDSAMLHYDKVCPVTVDCTSVPVLVAKGTVYNRQGGCWGWMRAEAEFSRAVELEPQTAALHFSLGKVLEVYGYASSCSGNSGPNYLVKAWSQYQTAAKLDVANPEYQNAYNKLSRKLKRVQR